MSIFKSREQKRIEREIEIKKGINTVKRNIRKLEKNQREYISKARRAKRLSFDDQLAFLKETIKKTAAQGRMLERQLLNIETAMQIKNQAEAHAQFAKSMQALSKTISTLFGATDLEKTQKDFERAIAQAKTMEERMEILLDMSGEAFFEGEDVPEDVISESDIDRLIEEEALAEEDNLDKKIKESLGEIASELETEDN